MMHADRTIRAALIGILLLALSACGGSSPNALNQPGGGSGAESRTCEHFNPQRNPFFGDLHIHTTLSLDANTQGTRLRPHEAYQFARGERLGIQPYDAEDNPLRFSQLARPLDFAAVTDHADVFGEVEICTNPEFVEYNAPECQFYRERPQEAFIFFNLWNLGMPDASTTPVSSFPGVADLPVIGADGTIPRMPYCGVNGQTCLEAAKTPWRETQQAAEAFYDRSDDCSFTTFHAYEYTGSPQSNNLHRNVIFKTEVVPQLLPVYPEFPEPELLWEALEERCKPEDGCEYLTIPHNSNLSAGLMFKTTDKNGDPYTAQLAALRQANEPLAEVYQHKGQSECLNTMGAGMQDELCGFEIIPYNNLTGDRAGGLNTGPPLEQDFLREAMKEGLRLEETLGANPFKYGLISSTDTHLGASGLIDEKEFPGHGGAGKPAIDEVPPGLTDLIEYSPGGHAVIWAEQNTRESLYEALQRRETYGTTGTRPIVRFFGGWDIPANACGRTDFVELGYDRGVPMGGDLPAQPREGATPVFTVSALRDPGGDGLTAQPLQRIQIIKGWVQDGEKKETVHEVAGDPNNGASVDVSTCETSGSGFANLCAVWQDPDFDPDQHAFYYARVVENPSCRWSTYQCNAAGVDCSEPDSVPGEFEDCCNQDFPKSIQERAWTSPIWYRPAGTAQNES